MQRALSSLLCAAALLGAGCATQQAAGVMPSPQDTTAQAPAPASPPAPSESETDADAAAAALALPILHYSLDSSQLTPESQEQLAALAPALRKQKQVAVTIAGHTCELGTSEYNLLLGQQRAARARDYLVSLGVESSRVSTVSYGEEQPLEDGHTEEARAKNRRAELRAARAEAGKR